jgi:pSer/pThr/pTyr-binding forkhead associated (FHA) protein
MPAQLFALTSAPHIWLEKPVILLGRDYECDIRLDSRKISRRHCCIAQVGQELVVRDLGSTNGIRINGVRVAEGHLKAGDELTIGNHRYQFRWQTRKPHQDPDMPPSEEMAAINTQSSEEDLESCEEPVALKDSQDIPIAAPSAKPRKKG